jgi:hypothetical protein
MKHIHPSPHKFSETDWQTLGELEVRPDYDVERAIQVWLDKTLHPLDLHADLIDRILRSAHEAVTRALHFEDGSMRFKHIHVLAFGPRSHETKGQAWGFFRIEKLEGAMGADSSNHAIEFYLYLEGQ